MPPVLKIDTWLGAATTFDRHDELLLTSLDGQEGVSIPFTYELVLARDIGIHKTEVDGNRMLGTSARIGLLTKGKDGRGMPEYVHRVGCFSQFKRIGLSRDERSVIYKATLIPAVMLWGSGVTFRVFERMNVVDIIDKVLKDIRAHSGDVRVDLSRLSTQDFPRLAYCVQFRESSFGFVCRLMAQHGISYFFDRGKDNKWGGNPGSGPAENDTLVLVGPGDTGAKPCGVDIVNPGNVDIQGADDVYTAAAFTSYFWTSQRNVSVGNFNPISPTNALHFEKTIARPYDTMSHESPANVSLLRREEFPVPADVDPYAADAREMDPNSPYADENRFIKDYASETIHREEVDVFKFSAMAKNPTLVAGRTFKIGRDQTKPTGQFDKHQFLLTWVKIVAFEKSYMTSTGDDFSDFLTGFFSSLGHAVTFNWFKKDGAYDITSAMAGSAFDLYLKKESEMALAKKFYPHNRLTKDMKPDLLFPGSATQWAALLVGNIASVIKDIVERQKGGFTIQFAAVPWEEGTMLRPRVSAPRPVAEGPQLATVVGPRGSKKGEPFFDYQLGRVRVRFPWQIKDSAGADFTDRFDTSDTTAWVPVSQAWAGTNFGSQFMPRIGDQVLVEYLDGDPERPIITGRVYHADQGYSNLPFLNETLAGRRITPKTLFEADGQLGLTLSGIETCSTPKPEDGLDRYHLLRFDDHYNDEQILMRSQGRLDVTAKCCHYETTEGNRHVRVVAGKDADGKTVGGGSSFMTVGGEHDEHIGDSRYEAVDKDHQLTVKGDTQFDLKGDWINVVGGKLSLNAGTIVIEASQKLTLKVGGSTVVLNPCGIYLDGPLIHHQCGGPADTAADAQIKDVADASKADPGEPAYMRTKMDGGCGGGGGGGGKRGEHTVPAQHGLPCTQDPEGMICLPLPQLCSAGGGGA